MSSMACRATRLSSWSSALGSARASANASAARLTLPQGCPRAPHRASGAASRLILPQGWPRAPQRASINRINMKMS